MVRLEIEIPVGVGGFPVYARADGLACVFKHLLSFGTPYYCTDEGNYIFAETFAFDCVFGSSNRFSECSYGQLIN